MAANEMQPVQVQDTAAEQDAAPMVKSSVRIDPKAPSNPGGRFRENDVVHMSVTEGGMRMKGVFTVANARLHSSRTYYEYQLVDGNGGWYQDGAWVRERDLRTEKRR